MSFDVAVLGAGPAGLGAAWWLARKGARVAVLERAPAVGGLAASFEVGGIRVDNGSHRLHPATDPAIMAELCQLLGDDLRERPRNGRIRLEGRWIGFPLRTGDLLRHLPRDFAAGVVRDMLTGPLRRPKGDTFPDVVRARLGNTLWTRFYEPYAVKIWGVDPARLSGEQARRRIRAGSAAKLLAKVMSHRRPATFFYPRRGFGQLADAIAEAASEAGADIHCSITVSGVSVRDDGVTLETDAGQIDAGMLWSTIPLPALARMTAPAPPLPVLESTQELRFRAMLLVYLLLDQPQWTPFDAHYLPGPETPVTRISEPKNYRDGDDPAQRTVLCAEIPTDPAGDLWTASDAELADVVAEGVRRLGLPAVAPAAVTVKRLRHAYPIYEAGWEQHFSALDAWTAAQPRLLTLGRQGLFAHDNTHHTLAMAHAAAEAWQPGGFDHAAWTTARERFAAHVVED